MSGTKPAVDDADVRGELGVHASLALRPDPRSAGVARRFIGDFCGAAGLGEEAVWFELDVDAAGG